MHSKIDYSHLENSVRQGTAMRRPGRETATRLLQAAHELLEEENIENFSMRNVAKRADVSLANLMYYYPSRGDFVNALSNYVDSIYRTACEQRLHGITASPEERLKEVLRFCIFEEKRVEARRFFIQFWSLVGAIDDFKGNYLEQTFHAQTALLSDHIAALHPNVSLDEINRRATMISVMVQGLIVIKGPFIPGDKERERFLDSAFALALNIANDAAA